MPPKRRLAAILFADIAGYTAMMQRDENDGLRRVRRFREVLDRSVAAHQGDILQHYGDGSLVIFSSAVEAVTCAREVQLALGKKAEGLQVPVRIGIHVGDIVVDGDDIFGDGVNLASRVEHIAIPGSILITERVTHDIQSHPEFPVVALGQYQLKNVSQPLRVYALAGEGIPVPRRRQLRRQLQEAGGGDKKGRHPVLLLAALLLALLAAVWWGVRSHGEAAAGSVVEEKSVAVLPFRDLSPGGGQAYFGSGIAEEILFTLAQVPGLKVTGRASSFLFEGEEEDVRAIGEQLQVDAVLLGSVRQAGERVRIATRLVDTEEGYVLWSERYERNLDDVFAVQDEIAQAVARNLRVLFAERPGPVGRTSAPPADRQAYEAYLRGKYMLSQRIDGAERAVGFFEQALERDPRFALAHAGLANAFLWLAWGNYLPSHEAFPRARQHAQEALRIDSTLSYAYAILGSVHLWYDWKWNDARQSLERAVAINPSEGTARLDLGWLHLIGGDYPQAVASLERALQIDPLNLEYNIDLADFHRMAGHYEEALALGESMRQLYPDNADPRWITGLVHYDRGEYQAAEASFRAAASLAEAPTLYLIHQAMALAKQERGDEARQLLYDLQREESLDALAPVELAMLHLALGDRAASMALLERAYELHANWLISIGVDPVWKPLYGDPAFEALVEKMRFPRG